MKKIGKAIGNFFLILSGIILFGSVFMLLIHKVLLSDEKKLLEENHYINPVSVGDYSLNVCFYGSEKPKHTIVGISGLGVHNISLKFRGITDRFSEENRIVLIDRAGYGASEDTFVPRTTKQIVEDYRMALKNSGFLPPYVLLAHSIGAAYSTYWVSEYPEEIEGIVYLDGTTITKQEIYFTGMYDPFTNTLGEIAFKLGFQRLIYTRLEPTAFQFTSGEERKLDEALTWKNALSTALNSETKLINENCRFTYEHIVKTDVPKVYICSANGVSTKEEYIRARTAMHERILKDGGKDVLPEFTDAYVEEQLKLFEEFRQENVYPFAESVGNCTVELMPGTHMIYCDEPDKCAKVLEELIRRIEDKNSVGKE